MTNVKIPGEVGNPTGDGSGGLWKSRPCVFASAAGGGGGVVVGRSTCLPRYGAVEGRPSRGKACSWC